MLRKCGFVILSGLSATHLSTCQSDVSKPGPIASSAPVPSASAAPSAAAPKVWAGLSLPASACLDYCRQHDATDFRASRWCGGVGNHLMDRLHDTPACQSADGDLSRLMRTRPAECECTIAVELIGRGAATHECRQLCDEVLPFYDDAATHCVGLGSKNYGDPKCGPTAERLFDRFPERKLAYCGCAGLDLHRRLMERKFPQ